MHVPALCPRTRPHAPAHTTKASAYLVAVQCQQHSDKEEHSSLLYDVDACCAAYVPRLLLCAQLLNPPRMLVMPRKNTPL